jgi:hypothetical protein
LGRNGEHALQELFEGHCVGAEAMTVKEVTVAIPFAVCKGNGVGIIRTIHGYFEGLNMESFTFLGVPFGFLNLSNHSRVHFSSPIEDRERHAKK